MMKKIEQSIQCCIKSLLSLQSEDGRFEGRLSSNTYPTCAYGLVQLSVGKPLDDALINWLLGHQNDDGMYGLDASGGSDREATLFARLILKQAYKQRANSSIEDALQRIPDIPLNLWLIKHAYACCGEIPFSELLPPRSMIYLIKLMPFLTSILPSWLSSRLKPPTHIAPPVDFFFSSTFKNLFIAEQHTVVPLLLVIELNTAKRSDRIGPLLTWLKEHWLSDGSWFCVNYITSLSVLALIEARKNGYSDAEVESMIEAGLQWLDRTRNPDGGCREAINLNIWDTALSVISLIESGMPTSDYAIQKACGWLIEHQNPDGGWAFSGLQRRRENGKGLGDWEKSQITNLPSDADDTALSTLALLKSGFSRTHPTVAKGLSWLQEHQGAGGSWSTYLPGSGDVGCVSVTAHAIEALITAGEMESEIQRAILWLRKNINKDGYWSDLWLAKNTYGTACALAALIKAGQSDCIEVQRGINWLRQAQNPDGGWGEDILGNPIASTVEQTAWSAYALSLVNPKFARAGVEFLLNTQKDSGDWNSNCVGVYWEVIGGYIDPIYSLVFPLLALTADRKI
ncbi:MAG: prenyltransferase/squalene oxidase repeat-containing protein [Candidatus Poribacteria bacterium]